MAGFAVNTVTVDGKALLARILATDQLIYTRVLTSASSFTLAEAQTAQASDFSGPTGAIKAASADDQVARIVGAIPNAPTAATVKSFALCAKAEGDADDVVLAVQSDPSASVYIPSTAEPTALVEIGFLVNINNASSVTVEVVGTGSAALSDLWRLVSCNVAGDPTTGENQTVRGEKTLMNPLWLASSDMPAASYCKVSNRETTSGNMRFGLEYPNYTGYAPSVIMYANTGSGEYSETVIQSDALTINTTAKSNSHGVAVSGAVTIDGDLTINSANAIHFGNAQLEYNGSSTPPVLDLTGATLYSTGSGYFEGKLTAELGIKIWGDCEFATDVAANKVIIDSTTGNVAISKTLSVSGDTSLSGDLTISGNKTITITSGSNTCTIQPYQISFSDGTHSSSLTASGTGAISGTLDVGGLSGTEPKNITSGPDTGFHVPVGGIVGVIGKAGGYINTCSAGDYFSVAASTIKTAVWDCSTGAWIENASQYLPEGTYRAITGFNYAASGTAGLVIVIRVA